MRRYKLKILNLLLIYCSFFPSLLSIAQSSNNFKVSGKVFHWDKKPFSSFIYLTKNGKTKFTLCDSAGNFEFRKLVKGSYKLSFKIMDGPYFKDTTIFVSDNLSNVKIVAHLVCFYYPDGQNASNDIKNTVPKVFIINPNYKTQMLNGILPHITFTNDDTLFQKKYGITYIDKSLKVGYEECMSSYNHVIFEYLNNKFGAEWHKLIRKDAIGYNEK